MPKTPFITDTASPANSGLIGTGAYGIYSGLVARPINSASGIFNKISSLVCGGLAARLVTQ